MSCSPPIDCLPSPAMLCTVMVSCALTQAQKSQILAIEANDVLGYIFCKTYCISPREAQMYKYTIHYLFSKSNFMQRITQVIFINCNQVHLLKRLWIWIESVTSNSVFSINGNNSGLSKPDQKPLMLYALHLKMLHQFRSLLIGVSTMATSDIFD